jgi:hypothetical protein
MKPNFHIEINSFVSLIDELMMTYYMQGHGNQVNRLKNSFFDKDSKVKPTLSLILLGWVTL